MNGYMMLNATLLEVLDSFHRTGSMQGVRHKIGLAKSEIPSDYATAFADFQGRIGLAQLRKFDFILARHREWTEFYDRELRDVPGISPAPIIAGATYGSYTVRVERRDEIDFRRQIRNKAINIDEETRFDYVLPYMKPYRPYAKGPYSHAEQAAREVVNLPNYAGLGTANARYIVESIRRSLASPIHH
jgi:dTDP-4-amino-4,6-dideoxygalactose transaminase